jgi:hypothetical protein
VASPHWVESRCQGRSRACSMPNFVRHYAMLLRVFRMSGSSASSTRSMSGFSTLNAASSPAYSPVSQSMLTEGISCGEYNQLLRGQTDSNAAVKRLHTGWIVRTLRLARMLWLVAHRRQPRTSRPPRSQAARVRRRHSCTARASRRQSQRRSGGRAHRLGVLPGGPTLRSTDTSMADAVDECFSQYLVPDGHPSSM